MQPHQHGGSGDTSRQPQARRLLISLSRCDCTRRQVVSKSANNRRAWSAVRSFSPGLQAQLPPAKVQPRLEPQPSPELSPSPQRLAESEFWALSPALPPRHATQLSPELSLSSERFAEVLLCPSKSPSFATPVRALSRNLLSSSKSHRTARGRCSF